MCSSTTEPSNEELLNQLFDDDSFGLLSDSEDSIFNLRHVKPSSEKPARKKAVAVERSVANPDHDAELFKSIHAQLGSTLRLHPIQNHQDVVKVGNIVVLNGMIGVIMKTDLTDLHDPQPRLEIWYANCTKCNLYHASLIRALQRDPISRIATPSV